MPLSFRIAFIPDRNDQLFRPAYVHFKIPGSLLPVDTAEIPPGILYFVPTSLITSSSSRIVQFRDHRPVFPKK